MHDIKVRNGNVFRGTFLEETLSLKELFAVFTAAASALDSSHNLKLYIKQNDISFTHLYRDILYIPFFYANEIKNYCKQNHCVTNEEIKNACKMDDKKRNETIVFEVVEAFRSYFGEKKKRSNIVKLKEIYRLSFKGLWVVYTVYFTVS